MGPLLDGSWTQASARAAPFADHRADHRGSIVRIAHLQCPCGVSKRGTRVHHRDPEGRWTDVALAGAAESRCTQQVAARSDRRHRRPVAAMLPSSKATVSPTVLRSCFPTGVLPVNVEKCRGWLPASRPLRFPVLHEIDVGGRQPAA